VACGIDWAEGHHDVAIVDEAGVVIVAERIAMTRPGVPVSCRSLMSTTNLAASR